MADYDSSLPIRTETDGDVKSVLVDKTTPSQSAEIDANGDLHTLSKIVDETGTAWSDSNPVPVYSVDNPAAELHDFDQAVAVAKDASSDHSYAPSGTGLKVRGIWVSGSGKAKFEIKWGATASEVLGLVVFNSTSKPNEYIELPSPITLADGTDTIIVTKTNLDNQAQDLYSTIIGDLV